MKRSSSVVKENTTFGLICWFSIIENLEYIVSLNVSRFICDLQTKKTEKNYENCNCIIWNEKQRSNHEGDDGNI